MALKGGGVCNKSWWVWLGTQLIALYVNAKILAYFDSFGFEHIPKEIVKFIGNKNITTNMLIRAYNLTKNRITRSFIF